jgi:hypothetical protein
MVLGMFKPNPSYTTIVTTMSISPLPLSVNPALKDPNWRSAMQSEFDALHGNATWEHVPWSPDAHIIVRGKWVFRHKFKEDGGFDGYKARWVVRGFT